MGELRNVGQVAEDRTRGKIWNHMEDLATIVDILNDSIATTGNLTKSVCSSETPSEVKAKDTEEPLCELSSQLIEQVSRIKVVVSVVHSINDRIQL